MKNKRIHQVKYFDCVKYSELDGKEKLEGEQAMIQREKQEIGWKHLHQRHLQRYKAALQRYIAANIPSR